LLSANTFNESLGGSYDQFDRDLRSHLAKFQPKSNFFETVNAPNWQIGSKWKYERRRPGFVAVTESEFIRRDAYVGVPTYVLRSGSEESFVSTESLSLVARKQNGKYIYRVSNNEQLISWPLRPQKQWESSFTRADAEIGATRSVKQLLRVTGIENIAVKAGQLKTVKIESYGINTGRLVAEYWYAPDVKWFARTRIDYRDFGMVEEELVTFKSQ